MTEELFDSPTWWNDPAFQDRLVALLVQDHTTLRTCSPFLVPDDFKPSRGVPDGNARWIVAERALEYFERHNAPIGTLIRADVLDYATKTNLGSSQINDLLDYLKRLQKVRPAAPDFLVDKVISFKGNTIRKNAINELSDLLASGLLENEKWEEISRRVQDVNNRTHLKTINYLQSLENRIERRKNAFKIAGTPQTFIDPLDAILKRTVGPKQMGLIIAPYKRGKSQMLLWLVIVLALQKYNVLFITLEDSQDIVEDRLDAIVAAFMGHPIKVDNLINMPRTLTQRFERFKNLLHSRIELFDGVGQEITMTMVEQIIREKRNEGFIPQVLIIDYDEKITPTRRYKEKRFELDEVYTHFGNLVGKYNLIGWMAAQTQRNTHHMKILTGNQLAEDIGKARKVTCAITLGKGDWADNSIYLWVAAHKTHKMEIGCEIIPNFEYGLIYDREATQNAARQHSGDS